MLGNTIVSSVDVPQMDAIPRNDQRIEQVKDLPASFRRQKALDILKDKGARP